MFSLKSIRNATTPSIKLHYKIILCGLNKSRLVKLLHDGLPRDNRKRPLWRDGNCGELGVSYDTCFYFSGNNIFILSGAMSMFNIV